MCVFMCCQADQNINCPAQSRIKDLLMKAIHQFPVFLERQLLYSLSNTEFPSRSVCIHLYVPFPRQQRSVETKGRPSNQNRINNNPFNNVYVFELFLRSVSCV